MERDTRSKPPEGLDAEPVEEEDMDTSGHGDKLQNAVDKVADRDTTRPSDSERLERVEKEDMDTRGHGDPQSGNVSRG